jgi:hypothetical protein
MRKIPLVVALAVLLALPVAGQSAHKKHLRKAKAVAAKTAAAPAPMPAVPMPPAPELPKRPFELPAEAVSVQMRNGMLTIDAPNSRLADVLGQIQRLTGAPIEGLALVGNERVATHLGPLPPGQAMLRLLEGSRLNYIVLAPQGNPSGLAKLILTPRSGDADAPQAAFYEPPMRQRQPPPDAEASNEPEDAAPAGDNNDGNDPAQRPNTPEDMLKQLRDRHQTQPPQQPEDNGQQNQ